MLVNKQGSLRHAASLGPPKGILKDILDCHTSVIIAMWGRSNSSVIEIHARVCSGDDPAAARCEGGDGEHLLPFRLVIWREMKAELAVAV